MRALPAIVDPVFVPGKATSFLDRFWLSLINDERDLPFIYLTLRISLIMVPLGILMFMPFITGWMWWAIAAAYFYCNNFVFKGPFGLMLHCTSHRPWFKKKYSLMNFYLPWFIGPFFGQTPDTYASHHLGMHHRENNMENDLSSTMHYQRDSIKDFMKYYMNFFIYGVVPLIKYFNDRKQIKLSRRVIKGELAFIVMAIGLCFVNWPATVMVFILPLLISRLIMMMGNWAQHSFIDADDPGNDYTNSITCINAKYNHKCWNDGYHISHHVKPAMHWTLHPAHLQENLDVYAKNKSLIFEGVDFLFVWKNLMFKNYDLLQKHLVNVNGMFASEEEAIALMKLRTAKIAAAS